jgi:hypothetical protein
MSKKKYVYTYNKKCEVCTKDFQTQRYGTKICSPECVSIKLSQKRKYTDSQVELAIALRLQGVIIPEIVKQTGIKKPSLQKIFQEKDIKLSEEDKKDALAQRWTDHEPIVDGKKQCSKCNKFKFLEDFHKANDRLTGVVSACKDCCKDYYEENSDKIIKRNTEYRENNPEKAQESYEKHYEKNANKYLENAKRWSSENPEKRKEIEKRYSKRNPGAKAARTASYRARKKQAQPNWLTEKQLEQIKQIYIDRPAGHHVDHIVPIAGDNVCGLHVPWNLAYLPEYQNESKGNRFTDQTIEVGICHQYKRKMDTFSEDIDSNMPVSSCIKEFDFATEKFNNEHKAFIERYEWLGTVGYSPKWIFTARVNGILGGVVIITEPNGYTNNIHGKQWEAQITRGATASWTPKNLGSKLVMFSCNWMVKNTYKRLFFGYSDHAAGEVGTIYQACNFMYLGNHFGATVKYELENGKKVTSRYFRKTSTFRKYAKELGIDWQPTWTKENKYMNRDSIPPVILDLLNKKGKFHQEKCKTHVEAPKGKYVLILGKDKKEKKLLDQTYLGVFGKPIAYPKRGS